MTSPIVLEDDSTTTPDELLVGDVRLVIHKSGGHAFRCASAIPTARSPGVSLVSSGSPSKRATVRSAVSSGMPQPKSLQVMNTYGDVDTYKSEGVIEFTLEGRRLTLRPFTTRPNRFYIVFRDASSGSETYEAARFLYADLLEDGTTVLDFNEAYNPPCAFNPVYDLPNSDSGESAPGEGARRREGVSGARGSAHEEPHRTLMFRIRIAPTFLCGGPLTVLSPDPSSCRRGQAGFRPPDARFVLEQGRMWG